MSKANESGGSRQPIVTSEVIEAAVRQAHREREQAFWHMLQAIFGRPENRNDEREARPARRREPAVVIGFAGRA